jgi:hypothetical protein
MIRIAGSLAVLFGFLGLSVGIAMQTRRTMLMVPMRFYFDLNPTAMCIIGAIVAVAGLVAVFWPSDCGFAGHILAGFASTVGFGVLLVVAAAAVAPMTPEEALEKDVKFMIEMGKHRPVR